jgi:hypothetical protein
MRGIETDRPYTQDEEYQTRIEEYEDIETDETTD